MDHNCQSLTQFLYHDRTTRIIPGRIASPLQGYPSSLLGAWTHEYTWVQRYNMTTESTGPQRLYLFPSFVKRSRHAWKISVIILKMKSWRISLTSRNAADKHHFNTSAVYLTNAKGILAIAIGRIEVR